MVKIVLEEFVSYQSGRIVTEATVYAEKTIRHRIEYLSEKFDSNYNITTDWYPGYLLLSLYPNDDDNADVRLDDVKDTIISLVKQAIEDVKSLKQLEVILDI